MPTYEATDRFWREHRRLTVAQRAAFKRAVEHFVAVIWLAVRTHAILP